MSDLNKVMLIGRLGQDPEVKAMPSGDTVANFSIATTEKWKKKDTGEAQERTEWHRISVFGGLARVCGEYLRKGAQVYIEGQIRTRKWQDKQGNDRFTTEIIGKEMQMLGSKRDNQGGQAGDSRPADRQDSGGGRGESGKEDTDDDIPF